MFNILFKLNFKLIVLIINPSKCVITNKNLIICYKIQLEFMNRYVFNNDNCVNPINMKNNQFLLIFLILVQKNNIISIILPDKQKFLTVLLSHTIKQAIHLNIKLNNNKRIVNKNGHIEISGTRYSINTRNQFSIFIYFFFITQFSLFYTFQTVTYSIKCVNQQPYKIK